MVECERMTHANLLHHLALRYRNQLPDHIRCYLNERGISDSVIWLNQLGWTGEWITIPIRDREGRITFFRLAKDPQDTSDSPKMLTPSGQGVELYGWERVKMKPEGLVICEGEFDRLVLERHGIPAITSTGGAGVFKPEWAAALKDIPRIWICFDQDEAGSRGAERVGRLIPRARLVELPEDVGSGGDVTDFFVRLGRNRDDFIQLLREAKALPKAPRSVGMRASQNSSASQPRDDVTELKSRVRIEDVVKSHVTLLPKGRYQLGCCPFHEDRTPSFVVYSETQRFHCFGCGASGDVIEFIMRTDGIGFSDALDRLQRRAS